MADDDVEAMLEAALNKEEPKAENGKAEDGDEKDDESSKKKKKKRDRSRSKDRDRKRSRSKERKKRSRSPRKRSRSKKRSRSPRKRSPDRSRERMERGRGRDYRRDRFSPPPPPRRNRYQHTPSPDRTLTSGGRRLPGPERRDVMPFTPRRSPPRGMQKDMTSEERDQRTVFIMQLSHKTRPRDLEDFFSSVGRVRDVRIITDSKTRRSKGIGYVEFWDLDSVPLAIALNGQRLLGAPLSIQQTQSEKNRAAGVGMSAMRSAEVNRGPLKVYIGSLHFNITEEMLRGIFEPFGYIEQLQLMKDTETDRSRGYGFCVFRNYEDGKRAIEQLNGFELAGRPIKVGHVTDHMPVQTHRNLDTDDMDRAGVDLGTAGRLNLMAKLAEGTGLKLPSQAEQVLLMDQNVAQQNINPNIATQCFMLSNMFDPSQETDPNWADDIRDDVIEECSKHGGVLHIFVDKESASGTVYVKCPSVATAAASVHSLHGRWFAGKVITGNFVPVNSYHNMFKDAQYCVQLMKPAFQPSNERAL